MTLALRGSGARHRCPNQVGESPGPGDVLGEGAGHEPGSGGQRLGGPWIGGWGRVRGDGGRLDGVLEQRHRRRAVRHGMVELHHHGDAVAGDTLDHPEGPEGAVPGKRGPGEGADGAGQCPVVAGRVEHDPTHVAGQIEAGVLHPHRVAQAEGDGHHPTAERRQSHEQLAQHLGHGGERIAALQIGQVRHGDLDGVHVGRRCLRVEELGIQPGQGLHGQRASVAGGMPTVRRPRRAGARHHRPRPGRPSRIR